MGSLEPDLELAAREELVLQRQLQLVHQKVRECEEIYRGDLQVNIFIFLILNFFISLFSTGL